MATTPPRPISVKTVRTLSNLRAKSQENDTSDVSPPVRSILRQKSANANGNRQSSPSNFDHEAAIFDRVTFIAPIRLDSASYCSAKSCNAPNFSVSFLTTDCPSHPSTCDITWQNLIQSFQGSFRTFFEQHRQRFDACQTEIEPEIICGSEPANGNTFECLGTRRTMPQWPL